MNKIIKLLILNDLFFWTALGLVGPILAIYINDDITGSTLGLTGLAMALYWIMKSVVSIITSKFTDQEQGNKAELWTLVVGSILLFAIPLGYLWAESIWHIMVIQAVYGFGAGFVYPGWMTIFTRFLKKGHEGFSWSVEGGLISFGNGLAVAVSGFVAEAFGFNMLFYIVLFFNFLSLLMIIYLLRFRQEILDNQSQIRQLMSRYFHH